MPFSSPSKTSRPMIYSIHLNLIIPTTRPTYSNHSISIPIPPITRCGVLDVLIAHDVQEGLLLPGEGGVRQVLRGGRGAHGEGELLVAAGDALPLRLGRKRAPWQKGSGLKVAGLSSSGTRRSRKHHSAILYRRRDDGCARKMESLPLLLWLFDVQTLLFRDQTIDYKIQKK